MLDDNINSTNFVTKSTIGDAESLGQISNYKG
jgi:hypothetical protein